MTSPVTGSARRGVQVVLVVLLACAWSVVAVRRDSAGEAAPMIQATLSATTVPLGGSVTLHVVVSPAAVAGGSAMVWPFVGGLQWGAFCNITADTPGLACDIILPNPIISSLDVDAAILAKRPGDPYCVGVHISACDVIAKAAAGSIATLERFVGSRTFGHNGTMVMMEWEPWFTPDNADWTTNEAVPLVGFYDSFNVGVLTQHALWMRAAGVDAIVVDWTNNLWNKQSWSQRGVYAQNLINATTFTVEQYAKIRQDEQRMMEPPKVVLLLGLDNGPSEPMKALNEEVAWIADNYVRNYSSSNWVMVEGKPLLLIFDGGNIHVNEAPLVAPDFTVRWMSTQLQSSSLATKGYWSWMDGSKLPIVTKNNGRPEAMTVTPAYFSAGGWLAPAAMPRRGGSTFLTQLQYAVEVRPEFLVICQWNEFVGTAESPSVKAYADSYNSSLSNDIEPTAMTDCAYHRPNDRGCFGWGFSYLNQLHAATYLLEHPAESAGVTMLAIHNPVRGGSYGSSSALDVEWEVAGTAPSGTFRVLVDGKQVASAPKVASGPVAVSLDLASLGIGPGPHTVSVTCDGCQTVLPMDPLAADMTVGAPVAAEAAVAFEVFKAAAQSMWSEAVGFAALTSTPPYEYGPTILLESGVFHAWYCSPGTGTNPGAWDCIRHTTSKDGLTWSDPTVALTTSNAYNYNSVCDPSVVQVHGVYFMYHTCINTVSPPDGYKNNRICVAMADSVDGPWRHYPTPVVQNLTCPSKGPYCVGQPSAVFWQGTVYLYYTQVTEATTTPPNPGVVLLATSTDGVTFTLYDSGADPLLGQRDVDVKVERDSGTFLLLQGDVGSDRITWSTSPDGKSWQPYNADHAIKTNPGLPAGGSNNNPGLAGAPDGTFGGTTFGMYGSSYKAGWGDWHLFRTNTVLDPAANNCTHCAPNSCDFACAAEFPDAPVVHGTCAHPGSTDPGMCCSCSVPPTPPDCSACAPGGCVAACVGAGRATGWCGQPGSTDPAACCSCSAPAL